ncbi:MAG: hypothetical protein ACM3NQ_00215, partial [Bacteroidales bacterium]
MQKYWLRGLPLLFALVAVVALFSDTPASVRAASLTTQQTQAQATPQRFTAFAANLSGRGRAAQTVDIEIKHWSTDAQRDELLQVLRNKGEQALLDALQKMPVVGTIRTPDSLAYDLHYARSQPWDDGGEQVLIATDRYINYWEAANASRTLQYPFTVIQMRVKGTGQGEGRLS